MAELEFEAMMMVKTLLLSRVMTNCIDTLSYHVCCTCRVKTWCEFDEENLCTKYNNQLMTRGTVKICLVLWICPCRKESFSCFIIFLIIQL